MHFKQHSEGWECSLVVELFAKLAQDTRLNSQCQQEKINLSQSRTQNHIHSLEDSHKTQKPCSKLPLPFCLGFDLPCLVGGHTIFILGEILPSTTEIGFYTDKTRIKTDQPCWLSYPTFQQQAINLPVQSHHQLQLSILDKIKPLKMCLCCSWVFRTPFPKCPVSFKTLITR